MHLTLPSMYVPYNFKSVNLADKLSPSFVAKFSRAVDDDDLKYTLEAVQTAIDIDVNLLTEGDFFYTLAVMRIMAFKRNPLIARWQCTGSELYEREDTGERWTPEQLNAYVSAWEAAEDKTGIIHPNDIQISVVPCNFNNEEIVSVQDLIIHTLPDVDEPQIELDPRLDYPRAALIPEAYELSDDLEYGPFVRVAKWVREGKTLIDKIELVMADMDLYEAALNAERTIRHGVTRYIAKSCKACDHTNSIEMEISSESFL